MSVVVPVYLSEDTIVELTERLIAVFGTLQTEFEIIFVNDASPDKSSSVISQIRSQVPQVRLVELSKNGGQQNAIRVGLQAAEGDIIVVMDADLQDAPEGIVNLFEVLQSTNSDAVFARRTEHYQKRHRMITSRIFKWLVHKMVGLPQGTGCFLIMSKRMSMAVLTFKTHLFYLPGLICKTNLPIQTTPLERQIRAVGVSTYSTGLRLKVAISNIRCLLERG